MDLQRYLVQYVHENRLEARYRRVLHAFLRDHHFQVNQQIRTTLQVNISRVIRASVRHPTGNRQESARYPSLQRDAEDRRCSYFFTYGVVDLTASPAESTGSTSALIGSHLP